MRKRLYLLIALTMCISGVYAQFEPKGNLVYCSIVDEGVAHMGTDIGTLTVESGKMPKIETVLHERCHFAERISGEYEVSPKVVKDLQKLILENNLYAINNYVEEEMIEGGHEYSIYIKYDSGDVISARWHTTSPNPGVSKAYTILKDFFDPWFKKLESGVTNESLPKVRTSNKNRTPNGNKAYQVKKRRNAGQGTKKRTTYKRR